MMGARRVYEVAPVALRFGAVWRGAPSSGREQLYTCPLCGETKGHLYINPATQEFYCHRCGAGGLGGVEFYQLATGLSFEQALRDVRGLRFGAAPAALVAPRDQPRDDAVAPLERRDRVYRTFLRLLPLYPGHLEDLRRRGLPDPMIRCRYASVPVEPVERWSICRRLLRDGCDLESVPGFYVRESRKGSPYWDFACFGPGFFIPVMSASGLVQALKIRLESGGIKRRYLTFSSIGRPGGASPGAPVHVAVPVGGADLRRVWVTEGELKADVAAHLLSRVFVSIPGVQSWGKARAVLEDIGAREVVIAFDADQDTNPDVANAKEALVADLAPYFQVFDSRWDRQIGKGIDDALVFTKRDHEVSELEFISGEAAVHLKRTVAATTEVSVRGAGSRPGLFENVLRLLFG